MSLKGIFSFIGKILSLFRKKPPVTPGRFLVSTRIETIDGKKIQITTYSDGTTERKEINDDDPTNVGSFINNLPR